MADLIGRSSSGIAQNITIPYLDTRGPKGLDGANGIGISSITMDENYILTITLSDGTSYSSPSLKGPKGDSVYYDDTELKNELQQQFDNYYTKDDINNMITTIPKFSIQIVDELPSFNISNSTIYLLRHSQDENYNMYDEYIYTNDWEKLGTQSVDLTNYITTNQLSRYSTTIQVQTMINDALRTIVDGDQEEY